ncbi:MAG TPA: response regulator transcription factor [Acidobacteriaceae bacterium]|nr:response regulator transcription factor [Acidobacteriaceae bacterium]
MRILVAEDDAALGMFLQRGLEADGHEVRLAPDGQAALESLQAELPDLAVLDLNMPRLDGTEVLRSLRAISDDPPVLVLSARNELEVRLNCFELGADDCMAKPFALAELRARLRVLAKRRRKSSLVLRHGNLQLNRVERTVERSGEPVSLTGKEFALLEFLLLNRGRPVSRVTLLHELWHTQPEASTNVVDVYVNYLRRKLSDGSEEQVIQTVRGKGYAIGLTA